MKKHKDTEVPGNVLATAAMTERILGKMGLSVYKADARIERLFGEGIEMKAIRFKAPTEEGGEWFSIITARTENADIVAFHSAACFSECVEGVCNRIANASLKWKDDEYAK